jgi:membrane protein implicated in regulation of membrane protease activity
VNVLLTWFAVVIVALGTAAPALAYVGPGAGLSLVGAFWGLLVALFAALAFVVLWPIRRFLKQRRRASPRPQAADAAEAD